MSRANAVKHGLWAETIPIIERGPLSEDYDEVWEFRATIFEELDPQTPLERVSATRIASLAWKLVGRLSRWEALALSDERLLPERPLGWSFHDQQVQRAEHIKSAAFTLRNLDGSGHSPWALENALNEIWLLCPGEPATPGWDPDRGLRPDTEQGWRDLIDATWPLAGDSLETVITRIEHEEAEVQQSADETSLTDAAMATRTLFADGLLDRLVAMEGHLGRELGKELDRYRQSRQRP